MRRWAKEARLRYRASRVLFRLACALDANIQAAQDANRAALRDARLECEQLRERMRRARNTLMAGIGDTDHA